jgi:predicted phage gp36 major capsid-like protein
MKAILYILAILVTGGAAYYSYDHSVKFKDQQKLRLGAIEKNVNVSATADATEKDLKDEQGVLKTERDKREEATQSIAALKSNEIGLKRQVGELDGTLEEQNVELASLEKALEEVKIILKELGDDVTLDNLSEKIDKVTEDKKNLERQLEDKQTLVSAAEKRLTNNKAEAKRLTEKKMERNHRMDHNALEAVITGVNQDWGFVVIGAGSNTGFTPQTSLLVKRDGRLIGRVRPSAIEPSQTIADIDLESLASGVRLQRGDRVILAKPESR